MKLLISCNNFVRSNLNKQPWKYVYEIANFLVRDGHEIVLVTNDCGGEFNIDGIRVVQVKKLFQPFIGETKEFKSVIIEENPDKIVMLLGLSSFLRVRFDMSKPVVGIITSPVYKVRELIQNVGIIDTLAHMDVLAIHYTNALIPKIIVKHWGKYMEKFVVLSDWNKDRVIKKGIRADTIIVIPPSIDSIWLDYQASKHALENDDNQRIPEIVYFTAPSTLRGTTDLIDAFSMVVENIDARLNFIFRIDSEQSYKDIRKLRQYARKKEVIDKINFIIGNLKIEDLIIKIDEADIICIPFKIVISDVPISIMEAMARGVPVISTDVACIPEILIGNALHVKPSDPKALSEGISMLLSDVELRKKFGNMCTSKMELHPSWETVGGIFNSSIGDRN